MIRLKHAQINCVFDYKRNAKRRLLSRCLIKTCFFQKISLINHSKLEMYCKPILSKETIANLSCNIY